MTRDDRPAYEPPQVKVLGTVVELTQQVNKDFGNADGGILFQNNPTTVP